MSSLVVIQKHAPERRKKAVTTLHCGCTCCCCCCLHTLGSIVGAAVAPAIGSGARLPLTYYYDEEIGQNVPLIHKPGLSAVIFCWWLLALLTFVAFAIGIVIDASGSSVLITGIIVLMVFPGLQLASVVLSVFVYLFWPRPDRWRQILQLAKITIGVVLGTVAGIVAMVGIWFVFSKIH